MKILVVDDDKNINIFLKSYLKEEGFEVDVATDGEEGLFLATTNEYDLIILDYGLPKKDGRTVCKEIREENVTCPLLFLSVQTNPETKAELLNLGADDYLSKPFSLDELIARVKALLRRPVEIRQDVVRVKDIEVDFVGQVVKKDNKEIYLTQKEFGLLEYLLKNRGKVVSRGAILEHVWDMNADMFSNAIEAHISNLRKKINSGSDNIIQTVQGRGYKIS